MELLEHPPYGLNLSLNLVLSDFYIFGTLDVAIRKVHASNKEEVKMLCIRGRARNQYIFFLRNHKVGRTLDQVHR